MKADCVVEVRSESGIVLNVGRELRIEQSNVLSETESGRGALVGCRNRKIIQVFVPLGTSQPEATEADVAEMVFDHEVAFRTVDLPPEVAGLREAAAKMRVYEYAILQ